MKSKYTKVFSKAKHDESVGIELAIMAEFSGWTDFANGMTAEEMEKNGLLTDDAWMIEKEELDANY